MESWDQSKLFFNYTSLIEIRSPSMFFAAWVGVLLLVSFNYINWCTVLSEMSGAQESTLKDVDEYLLYKEWDEVTCPICVDHPHNAVLLLCSSYDKGCRSYICDTSYRHSNCLDRFKRLSSSNHQYNPSDSSLETQAGENVSQRGNGSFRSLPAVVRDLNDGNIMSEAYRSHVSLENIGEASAHNSNNTLELGRQFDHRERAHLSSGEHGRECSRQPNSNLKCPLCRGIVLGWRIVEKARQYLDLKQRSCSTEACSFSGNYPELRKHARRVHPSTRPADVNPSRQLAWRHLERGRDYGDIMSAIRSAMPGATVFGDYVIDNEDAEGSRSFLRTVLMWHMYQSPDEQRRGISRTWRSHRRRPSIGASGHRRYLWGENLLGLHTEDDDDGWDLSGEMSDDISIPRRRRRLSGSTHNEDRS